MKCSSSGKESTDGVKFPCPTCGSEIVRSAKCRRLSIDYTCKSCNRSGP